MTSRRHEIHTTLVKLLNHNLNGVTYDSNIYSKVSPVVEFYDEVDQFPYVSVSIGSELRHPEGGITWSDLGVSIRVYTRSESTHRTDELSQFLEDISILLEKNLNLGLKYVMDITIQNIYTDEGSLAPMAVAEMLVVVKYDAISGLCT